MFRVISGFFLLLPLLVYAGSPVSVIARVTNVVDGDSFDARINGTIIRIRMLGINTNENGECHSTPAKERLEGLIEGEDVVLSASDASIELRLRPGRFVDLNGVDIGRIMLQEGLAIPYPNEIDRSRNSSYISTAVAAQESGIGIWDNNACGNGPSQSLPIKMHVSWDAVGDDSINVNGEWIDIVNDGSSSLSLNGWRLRDPSTRFYEFTSGTSVPAGGFIRVFVGSGSNSSTRKYWGNSGPIYPNDVGQGTYLLDPDNDIRAVFYYPCQFDCVNSLRNSIRIDVNYDAVGDDNVNPNGEWVDIINFSSTAVDLYGYFLESFYHFERVHTVPANSVLRVRVGQGSDQSDNVYAGRSKPLFTNSGGSIALMRSDGLLIDRFSWPTGGGSGSGNRPDRACVPVDIGDDIFSVICTQN